MVEAAGTLDAVRDSKAAGQALAVGGFQELVRQLKDGRVTRS